MFRNKKIFLIDYVFILIAFGIGLITFLLMNHSYLNNSNFVKIAGKTIKVELALTPRAQEQGLSGRKSLKEDEGMLFVFPQKGRYPFWMKDMNFAIDIIWINENNKVIYIQKDARPDSYPETFRSNEDAIYVLEVTSSFSDKNNLKVGDIAEFIH